MLKREVGKARGRFGITLVELLVVVAILGMVTIGSIGLLRTDDNVAVREAARSLHTLLHEAQARAVVNGRPAGVRLDVLPDGRGTSIVARLVEEPSPYSGDSTESRIWVGAANGLARFTIADDGIRQVRRGDRIKLNYRQPLYTIHSDQVDADGYLTNDAPFIRLVAASGVPRATPPDGVPFQIVRSPQPASADVLQLASSVAIDLNGSGISRDEFSAHQGQPITLLFGTSGRLDRVVLGNQFAAADPAVFLLIGKRENLFPTESGGGKPNWDDPASLWVAVQAATGQVTLAENAVADASVAGRADRIAASRRFARGSAIGGR